MEMTVQDLIDTLQKVSNKRQIVAACIMGVEIGETCILGVKSETPDDHDDPGTIGVCWLMLPEKSIVHEG